MKILRYKIKIKKLLFPPSAATVIESMRELEIVVKNFIMQAQCFHSSPFQPIIFTAIDIAQSARTDHRLVH
jgi:hypothetical protein